MIEKHNHQDQHSFIIQEHLSYELKLGQIDDQNFDEKETNQNSFSTKDNYIPTEKLINFQEVITQNLSSIYDTIAISPSNQSDPEKQNNQITKTKYTLRDLKEEHNLRLLLPVHSNIRNTQKNCSPNLNLKQKNKLITTSPLKNNQKSRTSRHLTEKSNQKQNIVTLTTPFTEKHVRIKSEKCIKYFPQQQIQSSNLEERNPQSQLDIVQRLLNQLSREFQYVGDFSIIRKQIVQLALSNKFIVMQNTNQFVTIKVSSKLDYCECLIKSCLSLQESGGIYQLKNSLYKRNKAKFTLISGNQNKFLKFFRKLLIQLWDHNKLKLKQKELVQFFVDADRQDKSFKQLKKQYTKYYNELSGLIGQKASKSPKLTAQSFISSLKQNIKRLKSPQKKKKTDSINKEEILSQFNQKINQKFNQMKIKLLSSQNLPQIDSVTIQKQLQAQIYFHQFPVWKLYGFHQQKCFEKFTNKKQEILKKYSLRKIFSYLQIQEQYSLFLIQKGRLQDISKSQNVKNMKSCKQMNKEQIYSSKIQSSVMSPITPYQQCIKIIESLNLNGSTPTKFLNSLQHFYKKLQLSYGQLYAQKPTLKLSSMDDELPVTIFIVLMSDLSSKSTAMNLMGRIKWILKWIDFQQTQMDNCEISQRQKFAMSKKILTTLQAAINFISNEWKIQNQSQELTSMNKQNQAK